MTRFLVALLGLALAFAVVVMMGFAGAYQYLAPEIPDAAALRNVKTQVPLRVFSRDGKLIAQIGEQRRIPVEWQQIPPVVVDAFLAAEDDRFFEHPGVDWQGLVRAVAANVAAGGVREGGHDHHAARAQHGAHLRAHVATQAQGGFSCVAART